jgi:UDP-3-O-[3-hydroxymyristoyl] N-acetylglucosamine deacetylase
MQARLRLLKGATALLYFGPLLAGIAGFGWRVVPLFVAISLLWLFILRPQQWPRKLADWSRPEALIALLTQSVVQLLLVAVSLGIGRGIGGVLGVMPAIPLMLPVAVSFLSIPLARMIWDPWRADAGEVVLDEALARLESAENLEMDFSIDFAEAAIGQQQKTMTLANGAFVRELSDSRTFCRQSDVDLMRANGLALGGTLENAVVFDGDQVLSPGGLRYSDEPVRHKMLDAMGDLFLAGSPILGRYTGIRAGHALTNKLLRALFAAPDAWTMVEVGEQTGCKLPGVGVHEADLPNRA